MLWNESVDEDATIAAIAQLEAVDLDSVLPPVQRCRVRARPGRCVQLQLQIIELEVVTNFVECERCVCSICPVVGLIDDELQRPIGLVVSELAADAVQSKACRAHVARLGVDGHLRLWRARVDPVVVGGERADRVAARDDVGAGRSSLETEILDVARRHSIGAYGAGDKILRHRLRRIHDSAGQGHPRHGAADQGGSVEDGERLRHRSRFGFDSE